MKKALVHLCKQCLQKTGFKSKAYRSSLIVSLIVCKLHWETFLTGCKKKLLNGKRSVIDCSINFSTIRIFLKVMEVILVKVEQNLVINNAHR